MCRSTSIAIVYASSKVLQDDDTAPSNNEGQEILPFFLLAGVFLHTAYMKGKY
jgi:hypothetical protein